jgi:DNA-binding transcriptional regulator LsrR (DeoR family)
MAEKALSNKKKKELAELLFLNSEMNQKQIAAEVGISEQAMVRWVKEGKWGELKTSLNANNAKQIAQLQRILQKLNDEAIEALDDEDPNTNPDADGIIKITKAIAYLRTKTTPGQMYETGTLFLGFLSKVNLDLAKQVAPLFTAFIKENL